MKKEIVKEIVAYNGTIVICRKDTAYSRTEFDEIIAAWQEQRDMERQEHWKEMKDKKRNIFAALFKRKEIA